METYDIIMLAVVGIAAMFGAIKGFAWQVASIASISVSYWVALEFREPFSKQIDMEPPLDRFLAMFILFVGTSLAIWIVFRMLARTIDRFKLTEFDRHVGAAFGLAKGVIYCILITMFAVALLGDSVRGKIVQSKSGHYIAEILDYSDKVMPEEIKAVVRPYLDRFDERMKAAENTNSSLLNLPAQFMNDGVPGSDQLLPSFSGFGVQADSQSFDIQPPGERQILRQTQLSQPGIQRR